MNQPQPTPAIATLRRFQAENPHITPLWLMGMDSFSDMPNWVEYPKHQTLCNLAVFHRKGEKSNLKSTTWNKTTSKQLPNTPGHIVPIDCALPDISATQIRQNPDKHQADLHQDTCNAILACYASG